MKNGIVNNMMNQMGRQMQGNIQNQMPSPYREIMMLKNQGFTPQQAYDYLMKDAQFVQSVNVARQQYPDTSFNDIAKNNGFDINNFNF